MRARRTPDEWAIPMPERTRIREQAMAARKAAQDNWPKAACPGRGRPHPVAETPSCPWCLPLSFYEDALRLEAIEHDRSAEIGGGR